MKEESATGDASLSPFLLQRVQEICGRFQTALQAGHRPQIEDCLGEMAEPGKSTLLRELLLLELEHRRESGEEPTPDEYRLRFPETAELIDEVFSKAATTVVLATTKDWQKPDAGNTVRDMAVSDPLSERRKLGRFELIEVLGRGSYGTVYRARDPRLDREVALKIPRTEMLADERDVQRFVREAKAAAQLRHPHIVPVHEADWIEGVYCFTSDFIRGSTVRAKIRSGWGPTRQEAAALIAKLASALHYAHNKGIVHRDVKPENVMLDEAGEPHIMDFGLARREEPDALRTQEGARMGTPAYMSPEQAAGKSHLADARSDLWSLGVMLYELLTGTRPFSGQGEEMLRAVLEREPDPPRKHDASIPKDLETICLKCLAKEPEQRYPSSQHLADELNRWLRGEPIEARPIGLAERGLRWCRRNPVVTSLLAVVVLSLLTGSGVSTYFGIQARHQAKVAAGNEEQAIESARQASRQQQRADRKAREAADNLAQARKSHATTRRYLYSAQIALIMDRWKEKDVAGVHGLLETLKPGPGEEDLRGFEWYYYWRLTHGYRLSLGSESKSYFSAVFLDDGKTLVAGGHAVTLWDAATGKEKKTVHEDPDNYYWLWATSDNRLLAFLRSPTLRVWEVRDDRLHKLHDEPGQLDNLYLAFSRDGRMLAVSHGEERKCLELKVVDLDTGKTLFTRKGFETLVRPLAFSPDNKTLVVGTGWSWHGGDVMLWDSTTGSEKTTLGNHISSVVCGEFSPDGKLLATSSGDITKLWDLSTGKLKGTFDARYDHPISQLAFSPDGKTLAAAGRSGSRVTLWDVATLDEISTLWGHTARIFTIRFSPDGKTLATASADGTVKLWDVSVPAAAGEGSTSLRGRDCDLSQVAVSPDGQTIATASADGTARLWNLSDGKQRAVLTGHTNRVKSVVFSPDGKTLLTGSTDKSIKIWDVATARQRKTFRDTAPVDSLAISPDGKTLAAGTWEEGVKLWDLASGRKHPLACKQGAFLQVRAVAFSPDGRTVAAGCSDSTVRLWEAATGKERAILKAHEKTVQAIAFSPDGARLASAGADQTARLWDVASGKLQATLKEPEVSLYSVAFSPDGKMLVAGGGDDFMMDIVHIWDLSAPNGQIRHVGEQRGHLRSRIRAAFSPDGSRLASAGRYGTFAFWDVNPEMKLHRHVRFAGHANAILSVAFGPDGKTVAVGKRDFTAAIVDVQTGRVKTHLVGHQDGVRCVAFSPDGRTLATGSWDATVKLWDVASGREKHTFQFPRWGYEGVLSVAFSPDGQTLASAGENQDTKLWDMKTLKQRTALKRHKLRAVAIAFSPDGRMLATAGGGRWNNSPGELKLWDAVAGKLMMEMKAGYDPIKSVAFIGSGQLLVTDGFWRRIAVWDTETGEQQKTFQGSDTTRGNFAISPDGRSLAVGGQDSTLQLWDLDTGEKQVSLDSHVGTIECLAFSPDGQTIASGGSNGVLHLWRAATQHEVENYSQSNLAENDSPSPATTSPDYELARMRDRFHRRLPEGQEKEPQAKQAYQIAVETYERLRAGAPQVPHYRHELAQIHYLRARRMSKLGAYPEALSMCRRSLAIWEKLVEEYPAAVAYRFHLATVCHGVAVMLKELDKGEEALSYSRRSVTIKEDIEEDSPSLGYKGLLALAYHELAQMLWDVQEHGEAVQLMKRSLVLWRNLRYRPMSRAGSYSIEHSLQERYQQTLAELGNLLERHKGKTSPLTLSFLVKAWSELVDQFPDEDSYRHELAKAYYDLGIRYSLKFGPSLEDALPNFSETITILRELVQEYPRVAEYREFLIRAYGMRARLFYTQNAWKKTLADLTEALRLEPHNDSTLSTLAFFLSNCPNVNMRDPRRAVELAEKAVKLSPKKIPWAALGNARYRAGQWKASIEALEKAVSLADGSLGAAGFFLAMAHWQLGHEDEARKYYDQTVQSMDNTRALTDRQVRRFRAEAAKLLGLTESEEPESEKAPQ